MPESSALDSLSFRHRRFVEEYVIDFNGLQAAIRAGFARKAARSQASRLLTKANIQQAVAELAKIASTNAELTVERVVQEIARICFADVRQLYGKNGRVLDANELDPDTAAAVAGIKVGEVQITRRRRTSIKNYTKEYKFCSKTEALSLPAP